MVPLLEDVEEGSGSGSDVSATMVGGPEAGQGEFSVTTAAGADAGADGPSITFYRSGGQPVVIDAETLQFWLLVIQTVALVALLLDGRRS